MPFTAVALCRWWLYLSFWALHLRSDDGGKPDGVTPVLARVELHAVVA